MLRKTPDTPRRLTTDASKFLCHRAQMENYAHGTGHSIICAHISVTGQCNLNCSYCACGGRRRSDTVPYPVLRDYIGKLKTRGLESVILTGGGEPTLYPHFNELVRWIREQGLAVALITNGTQSHQVDCWDAFSWVRVSINTNFMGWEDKIRVGPAPLTGASLIYDGQSHETLHRVCGLLDNLGAVYLRAFPDYLLPCRQRAAAYDELERRMEGLEDRRITVLRNEQCAPRAAQCHLSYFRPYLSEVDGGTVYLCCLAMVGRAARSMPADLAVCKAEAILDFLDGKITPPIVPETDCAHCLFAETIEALDSWRCGPVSPHDVFV